ncbi:GrpB family protein [Vallitalea okinawensis]|uniref:GrpB family protein n=1 Tax=Vallitalea okinawensis TaxID=2078660 RepID=UPI000CFAA428|nr:GrpB family protein [Vallitalea okinawensis]
MVDKIIIQEYSEEWPLLFECTAKEIRKSLGGVEVRIDHIGSTSIPNLAAKPIIDIQISVDSLEELDLYKLPLNELGYEYRKNNPEKTKRYFREKPGNRRTHIHVRKIGSWHEQFSLLFRDYLRTHSLDAKLYEEEKFRLAEIYRNNRVAYVEGKSKICWDIIFRADKWAGKIGWKPEQSDA